MVNYVKIDWFWYRFEVIPVQLEQGENK